MTGHFMRTSVVMGTTCALGLFACSSEDEHGGDGLDVYADEAAGGDGGGEDGRDDDDGDGNDDGDDDRDGNDDGDEDDDGADDGGIKYDVGSDDPTGGGTGEGSYYCTGVDILFVIDNSTSMLFFQQALVLAFPDFANTMVAALPPDTTLHVGVTSTEMGYSSSGYNTYCTSRDKDGTPAAEFYITPDVENTGRNGAQGRLYDPGGGRYFYEVQDTSDPTQVQGLKDWFADASSIGRYGSNIEMSCAPVGWVADPANDATNAGFVRDEETVMVVFFVQDEHDQTPAEIDGQPGGIAMLNRLAAAKSACGGADCILGGGFLNRWCVENGYRRPVDDFLDGLAAPAVVGPLPSSADAAAAAAEMNETLADVLADVIAQLCGDMPPPK